MFGLLIIQIALRHKCALGFLPWRRQGNYLEALECMERGLVLRQHFFGADSDEVWRACKTVGEMCNLLAMTYLQQVCASRPVDACPRIKDTLRSSPRGPGWPFFNAIGSLCLSHFPPLKETALSFVGVVA